ncbi:hypothetical protein MIMGU_mgv1a024553mg [Erythranthe guttata]|uniref:RING-type E3 ubiquitin transferase n=1 Tax=Erythranthe guttata TaxID=4155 RepID=A0A022QDM8_ERYGU|nr:hypothetical protein MIMGU_mgv1a024553mg [Erythranthe guttata]
MEELMYDEPPRFRQINNGTIYYHVLDHRMIYDNAIDDSVIWVIGAGDTEQAVTEDHRMSRSQNVNGSGLSEEDIENCLKTRNSCRKGEDEESDEICAICLDDMITSCEEENEETTTTAIRVLGCGHEYHVCCIKRWLCTKNSCPLCKAVASRRIENID